MTATDTSVSKFPDFAYTQTYPDIVPLLTVIESKVNDNSRTVPIAN